MSSSSPPGYNNNNKNKNNNGWNVQERTAQIELMEWDDVRVNKSFTQFRNVSEEDGGLMEYSTPVVIIVPWESLYMWT